jgi:hypothetical protein
VIVTESPNPAFGFSSTCSCCRAAGPTRRRVLAAGAGLLLASQLRPIAPAQADTPVAPLDPWLSAHGNVGRALVWDFGKGGQPYATWPEPAKARLRAAFALAWNGKPSGLVDPPPDVAVYKDTDFPITVLRGANAFALHAALVANSLAAEIGHRLPWSVTSYSDAALATLFDGRQTYARSNKVQDAYNVLRVSVPAPPETCLELMHANKMIGADRRATIVHALSWCRNLWHFNGANAARNNEDHWHYRGMPPASRIMSGTTYTGTDFGAKTDRRRRFTAGCWGTTGFLISLLRTANIPVQELNPTQMNENGTFESHSAPYFMTEGLCLSHGDDPYSAYCRVEPSFGIDQILIGKAQFDAWFPPGKKPVVGSPRNVSRRVTDLAIKHLPIYLLNHYAQDVAAQKTHGSGKVFQDLKVKYTMAELDAAKLWQRLDARLGELGGPQKVIALYAEAEQAYDRQTIATTAH